MKRKVNKPKVPNYVDYKDITTSESVVPPKGSEGGSGSEIENKNNLKSDVGSGSPEVKPKAAGKFVKRKVAKRAQK